MTESYGVLTVGSVNSGAVAVGEEVTGAGVASLTAIDGNLSGSGAGSTWLVNNAQTVAGENMTMTATPLSVKYNSIIGATANRDYFDVQPNADFGFDHNPSSLSYMGGTAAAALGLTQASGALDFTPGGQLTSAAAFMNNLVQNEDSQFGSFQATWTQLAQEDPEYLGDLAAWAQSTGGQYQFLQNSTTNTPPAGSSTGTLDPAGTYSGPGASVPTPAAAGTYIPGTGATSAAAEIRRPCRHVQRPGRERAHACGGRAPIFRAPGRPPPRRSWSTLPAHTAARAQARPRLIRRARIAPRAPAPLPRTRLARSARRAPARPCWRRPARIFLARARPPLRRSWSTLLAHTAARARARLLLRSPGIMSRSRAPAARRQTIPAITRRTRARRRRSWRCRRSYRAR